MSSATNPDPKWIPLEYVYTDVLDIDNKPIKRSDGSKLQTLHRLGIWIMINDSKPQRVLFDTGSDQLNVQILTNVGIKPTGSTNDDKYYYAYGSNSGYLIQKVIVERIRYFSHQDIDGTGNLKPEAIPVELPPLGGINLKIGKIKAYLIENDHPYFEFLKAKSLISEAQSYKEQELEDAHGEKNSNTLYVDQYAGNLIKYGLPVEERNPLNTDDKQGKFYGILGVGDFLNKKTELGIFGSATTTGYIISANTNTDHTSRTTQIRDESPGVIINLNKSLRAQFNSFTSILPQTDAGPGKSKFPGSNVTAFMEYDGNYHVYFKDAPNIKLASDQINSIIALLDTGNGETSKISISKKKFDALKNAKALTSSFSDSAKPYEYYSGILVIYAPNGEKVELSVDVEKALDVSEKEEAYTIFTAGLNFFLNYSVMYDLERKYTAYSKFFVSTHSFDMGPETNNPVNIRREMGSQHPILDDNGKQQRLPTPGKDGKPIVATGGHFGIASVISGKSGLIIGNHTVVRLTAANTYEGETHIDKDGVLELAGPGSIEMSSRIVNSGRLDLRQIGNYRDEWGIETTTPPVVFRDIIGDGHVNIGKHLVILRQAHGHFAGTITDTDTQGKSLAGKLEVGGNGNLTLSGHSSYTGVTKIGHGATLRLSSEGSMSGPVEVYGTLIVDGTISNQVDVMDGGVIRGGGHVLHTFVHPGGKTDMTGRPIIA